jgi:LacI family transcriptional regulator
VARGAGVSLATASRALDPASTHPISPATRLRVQEIAGRLGYRPNPMARGLRMQRLGTLAVVVNDISDPYFMEVIRAASAAASESGLLTMVCSSERSPEIEVKNIAMLRQTRVAAVLFAGGGIADADHERQIGALAREIRSYGGAVVALAPRSERWPAEVCDNRGGAAMAARHLVELGHRQIATITGPCHVRSSMERDAGYRDALSAARAEFNRVISDFTCEGGEQAAAELLGSGIPFTAVLVANDAMAMGALAKFREQGISVPGDVSVIGFGDVHAVRYLTPALTTIRIPAAEIAAAGVQRALDILEGRGTQPRVRVHPVELVIRESTASLSLPPGGARQGGGRTDTRKRQRAIAPR